MSDIDTAQHGALAAPEEKTEAVNPPVEPSANGSETAAEQAPEQERPRDEKGRYVPQERVNEITRARREAERERDYWRQQAEQFQQRQPQQSAPNGPPRIEDYNDFNAFNADNVKFIQEQAYETARRQLEQQQSAHYQQQVAQQFEARATQYESTAPGFGDRFETLMTTFAPPPQIIEALAVSEHGPHVFDYLAQHMDEADRLFRMPAHIAAIHIGRIEERLTAPKPKPPASNAPAPIPTLGGGSQSPMKDPAKMSDDEWYQNSRKGR